LLDVASRFGFLTTKIHEESTTIILDFKVSAGYSLQLPALKSTVTVLREFDQPTVSIIVVRYVKELLAELASVDCVTVWSRRIEFEFPYLKRSAITEHVLDFALSIRGMLRWDIKAGTISFRSQGRDYVLALRKRRRKSLFV
jgi:hypothetical protein